MYISNVKIRNYKNFYSENINFNKSITTVIGENGTGKTNLFNAVRLITDNSFRHFFNEDDFSYELNNPKCQWIIISIEFSEVPNPLIEPQAAEFDPKDGLSKYTLFFRPKKLVRNELYNLSKQYNDEKNDEEKIILKMKLENYINSVSIKNDYEIIRTIGINFDFLNDNKYFEMVGDFETLIFPNPDDMQEDKSLIGNIQNSSVNDYINVTFIPAIRDVNLELTKSGNFLENILTNISNEIDENHWGNVKNKFGEINEELQAIQEYNEFTDNVVSLMKDTVGTVYSSDMFLDVSLPEDKKYLIKYFSLKGKIDNHNLSLYNKSLGENNIIYFALKMLQSTYQEGHSKKMLNLIMIEEPEAHLHKHLQQTFLEGIKMNSDFQIMLSTHSVHISESSKVSSMIVLGNISNKKNEIYNPINELDENQIKYIERYLDATRSPILFSKNIILVEGSAELIFISNILKIKYDFDLNAYGISLISMDNCFFKNISLMFNSKRLRKKCSILTDEDAFFEGSKTNAEELSKNRIKELNTIHKDNDYVKVFTNKYTFEIEIYSNNLEMFKKYTSERKIYTRDVNRILSELDSNNKKEIIYRRIMLIAEKIGKGWLALDFIDWISHKNKSSIDAFKIPDYIIESLIFFFPSDLYSKNTYVQIIERYCKLMEKKSDDCSDRFINHIKECMNGK